MKKASLFLVSCFFSLAIVQAQSAAGKVAPPTRTLEQQFNALKARSSSYKELNHEYKVVRVDQLDQLWQNVQDSLKDRDASLRQAGKATQQNLAKVRQDLQAQKARMKTLKLENQQQAQTIAQTALNQSQFSFWGLMIDKQLYVILSLGVVLVLSLLAAVLAFLHQRSKKISEQKVLAFDSLAQELKEYKQTAREREIRIKRELQTEINRVEELNLQIAHMRKHAAQ